MRINEQAQRFELEENGHTAFANYRLDGEVLTLPHVEAPPALRGTGAAGRLMKAVCDHAKTQGWTIRPTCSYARAWIQKHADYKGLLK